MTTIVQYERARAALAKATRIDEIVPTLDEIAHVKLYARQIKNRELLADAYEFQERAERRLGEVIAAAKAAGHFADGRPRNGSSEEPFSPRLADVGLDKKLSARSQRAAAMDAETFEAHVSHVRHRVVSGGATLIDREEIQAEKRKRREARESELAARQAALPDKKYGVILADPEWRFEAYSRDTGLDRAADNHYPTSSLDAIKARDVGSIAAKDCALFLWATAPMLPQALEVMAAWGFTYKSHFIWNKDRVGTGYWFRNRHELLLLGTRGDVPAPAPGEQFASVIDAPVGRHSAKPELFLQIIELYFPTVSKIELNRRGPPRPGWSCWGLEAEQAA